ncbi:MAG: NAD-dependent epimerase/dehydratase family protein [Candidatus Dormibacteraeota bacterium]|nr:NAD-dependent epimerase/dehydratase family protein [Candidatus Dormibacteraeota bacterium]
MRSRYLIIGGAGFIGSHFVDRLLADPGVPPLTVYDNFCSGREWHLEQHAGSDRLRIVRADAGDLHALAAAMRGHDVVIHLASNADISRAAVEPTIDFAEGTVLTQNVVEAMRLTGTLRILYASGSGIYGDLGESEAAEDHGPLEPISTYGASKLAGEALIAAYCHMFGLTGCVFRFGNVVGPRQTHGVGFDFIRQLRRHPDRLRILGDGTQSKSYVHVDDVVSAVLLAHERCASGLHAFNVATGDYITVREIAELAISAAGLAACPPTLDYTGGDRGWKGDVPVVRLNTQRIRALGWSNRMSSKAALEASMQAMLDDEGRLWS